MGILSYFFKQRATPEELNRSKKILESFGYHEYDPYPIFWSPFSLNWNNQRKEAQKRLAATIVYIIMVLVMGIPMWWWTTSEYRAMLPIGQIYAHANSPLKLTIDVEICSQSPHLTRTQLETMINRLREKQSYADVDKDSKYMSIKIEWNLLNNCADEINNAITSYTHTKEEALLTIFRERFSFGLTIAIVDSTIDLPQHAAIYFSGSDVVYLHAINNMEKMQDKISSIIFDIYIDEREYISMVERADSATQMEPLESVKATASPLEHFRRIWTALSRPKTVIDFIILDAGMQLCCPLNLTAMLHQPLANFYTRLNQLSELKISNVHLFDVDLATEFYKADDNSTAFLIKESSLEHIIDPLERHLTTIDATSNIFRIVLYLTPNEKRPTFFVKDDSEDRSTAAAIADWGGIVVVNDDLLLSANKSSFSASTINNVVQQLRVIYGVDCLSWPEDRVERYVRSAHALSRWEFSRAAMKTVVDATVTATWTLRSLMQMLHNIPNMPIYGRAADFAYMSTDSIATIRQLLGQRSNTTDEILELSLLALSTADAAYFDDALVSKLYFPDDQKHAIYIPLFLPVCLPVTITLLILIKYYCLSLRAKVKSD